MLVGDALFGVGDAPGCLLAVGHGLVAASDYFVAAVDGLVVVGDAFMAL